MNNTVILNKDASTWPRIKKYWEDRGADTSDFNGESYGSYYGFVDNIFGAWDYGIIIKYKAEIIELPEEQSSAVTDPRFYKTQACAGANTSIVIPNHNPSVTVQSSEELPKEEKKYPRLMWVWDEGFDVAKVVRVVLFEVKGKVSSVETAYSIKDLESMIDNPEESHVFVTWDHATEIEPEIEVTLEEIAEWKGVSKEQVKVKM